MKKQLMTIHSHSHLHSHSHSHHPYPHRLSNTVIGYLNLVTLLPPSPSSAQGCGWRTARRRHANPRCRRRSWPSDSSSSSSP